jgi:uncharacterized OsmC-like protein/alpha-beta hydrolase superfamily lysophospholipase
MAATSEKVTFTGATGETLAARLDRPDGAPKAYALFAHCFTCSKDIFAAARIAQGLVAHGIAVLRFDFTGLGASEGEFANTNFSSNVGDLIAAADFLRSAHEAPRILIGHSLGGAAVLAAAPDIAEAQAVCTVAAPADPAHVAHHFSGARDEIETKGEAEVTLVGRPFRIKKQFLDDIEAVKLEGAIRGLKKALLVFHSPTDATVGIENAETIYRAAKHPKSFVSLDDADHLLSRRADATYVADVIAAWATRYIGSAADETDAPAWPEVEPGAVFVREAVEEGRYATDVNVSGRFILRADEPPNMGGMDTGPTPYGFLMAALGACTTITMRMYADRKNWPVERFSVRVAHEKIHASDCAECFTKEGRLDQIKRTIEIEGDLDSDQRARLLEIADKCPVHRTLHSEIRVLTKAADDAG